MDASVSFLFGNEKFFLAEDLKDNHENTKDRKHEMKITIRLSCLRVFVINFFFFCSGLSGLGFDSTSQKNKVLLIGYQI